MESFEVVSPAGGEAIAQKPIAPRLKDLNGKTVAEIWNGVFKGDQSFPVLRRLLKEKYPAINIIPYTEFPHIYGGDNPSEQKKLAKHLAALAQAKGCDAVISGNGA